MTTKENVQTLAENITGSLWYVEVNNINYIMTEAEVFEGIDGDSDTPFEPYIFLKVTLSFDSGYNSTECSLLFDPAEIQETINNQVHEDWQTHFTFENDGSYGE